MSIKVLIVDDSRIFRSAVEEVLSRENDIEVVGSVWNGIKALEFIAQSPPHLITLDVQMPDMDGLATLREIQKINATKKPAERIGVIMLSSLTRKGADITVQALEMGAFDFIAKPESRNLRTARQGIGRALSLWGNGGCCGHGGGGALKLFFKKEFD